MRMLKSCQFIQSQSNDIDGILVVLPNFGDERAVADTIKLSDLGPHTGRLNYELDALNAERRRTHSVERFLCV